MVYLEQVSGQNAMAYKRTRLRALQDSPSAFGSTYDREAALSDAEWIQRAERHTGEFGIVYLAVDGADPCGIVGGFLNSSDASIAHVVSMWVAPSHRREGVGSMLVEGIQAWARGRGVADLHLMVTINNEAAMGFYRNLGFLPTGLTEPYPNDADLVEVEMSKQL